MGCAFAACARAGVFLGFAIFLMSCGSPQNPLDGVQPLRARGGRVAIEEVDSARGGGDGEAAGAWGIARPVAHDAALISTQNLRPRIQLALGRPALCVCRFVVEILHRAWQRR